MRLVDKILGAVGLQKKQSAVGSLISLFKLGQPVWTPRQYDKFAEEGYQKNVIAYASIREVAKGASSVPWLLYRKRGGRRVEITEHPLLNLLKRPNPMQGGACFFESVYGFFMISGNSYIEAVGPDNRLPRELYPHRPDRMKVIPGRFGLPSGYVYSVSGQTREWESDPITGKSAILHVKSFNPLNDWYGMSPIEAAAYGIDTHNQAGAWNKALLDNGARPSGAFVSSARLADEQFNRLREEIIEKYSGPKNAGKPLILEGGLEWKEMGLNPKDMEYINSKHTSARDIALAFGVPPMLLGIPGDNTYSNQKEARLALWENTILSLVGFIRDELNIWLTPMFGGDLELDYDEDQINALAPRREAVWERVNKSDFLTINEKREAVGYESVPGGDDVFVSMGEIPLGLPLSSASKERHGHDIECKLINDNTPEQRIREWGIQQRLMAGMERALAGRMRRLLDDQASKASAAYEVDGLQGVELSLRDHMEEVGKLLKAHYNVVMGTFGQRVLDAFSKSAGGYERKDGESFFMAKILEWINQHTDIKITEIDETTKKNIREAILKGEAEGLAISEIAKRIVEETGGLKAGYRATRIAVTETHSAAVASGDFAAEATGLEIKREWMAARDDRTRDTHKSLDGQVRGMDEHFKVPGTGVEILRPGDPGAPASETIFCRCSILYLTEEGI